MRPTLQTKLETMAERYEEINHLLADPDAMSDGDRYRELTKEFSQLQPMATKWHEYVALEQSRTSLNAMLQESDPEMKALAEEELKSIAENEEKLESELKLLLIPKDPKDDHNVYLEVRAGTGGDEAAIFAGDLFRMYARYAEKQRWHVEILSKHDGEHGGYKEIIAMISGTGVYGKLKFESGAHRVQRVPETEAQGRVHTSACTVAVLPEVEIIDEIIIKPEDLRVDTYRASGAGGQHVNKTDSAIRITHIPSGLVVECQEERSQHKNRAKAMSLLQSRLLADTQAKQQKQQAETRKSLVGSGDRSERIRTYNYPQGRLTDHRINLTLYKLTDILEGDLNAVIDALAQEHQMNQLSDLGIEDESSS